MVHICCVCAGAICRSPLWQVERINTIHIVLAPPFINRRRPLHQREDQPDQLHPGHQGAGHLPGGGGQGVGVVISAAVDSEVQKGDCKREKREEMDGHGMWHKREGPPDAWMSPPSRGCGHLYQTTHVCVCTPLRKPTKRKPHR